MLDHIGLQVSDVEASVAFYVRVFAPIGMHEAMRYPYGDPCSAASTRARPAKAAVWS